MGECITKHMSNKIVTSKEQYEKYSRKATLVSEFAILGEKDETVGFELNLRKRLYKDDKPVHISCAILQYSKLIFLKFVFFLTDHLIPGSFRTVYGDTGI